MDYDAQLAEIVENKTFLEQITGQPIRFLAWPFGERNESAIQAAAAAGIVGAFGLGGAAADLFALDPYQIPASRCSSTTTWRSSRRRWRGSRERLSAAGCWLFSPASSRLEKAAFMSAESTPVVRPGVRVVVIDDAERVLLFASMGDDGRRFWHPPGGGSEPGESAEETARRELREETEPTDVVLDRELWRRRAVVSWGVAYDCRERWFLARVAAFAVDTSGFSIEERAMIVGHRWWTLEDLEESMDRLVPDHLAALIRGLLDEGPPEQPIDIGI